MSEATLAEVVAELKRLEAAATPGPWWLTRDGVMRILSEPEFAKAVSHAVADVHPWGSRAKDDAALLVAMRNHLPALLAALSQRPDVAVVEAAADHIAFIERQAAWWTDEAKRRPDTYGLTQRDVYRHMADHDLSRLRAALQGGTS